MQINTLALYKQVHGIVLDGAITTGLLQQWHGCPTRDQARQNNGKHMVVLILRSWDRPSTHAQTPKTK